MSDWRRPRIGVLEIAVGVALGVLAANIIEAIAIGAYARYQIIMLEERLKSEAQEQQRQARARAQLRQQDAARLEQQRQRDLAEARAVKLAEMKKELAWRQFYQQPSICENMPNNETFKNCANEYIRQRQVFEQQCKPAP